MKNLKNYLLFGFMFLLIGSMNAQIDFNLLNAKTPEEIGKVPEERKVVTRDRPLPYGYIDNRDILWSKVVWEHIDLNEKINMPLYYPIDSTYVSSNRKSLFYCLLKGIMSGEIEEVYDDSFFKSKLTLRDIEQRLTRIDTSDYAYELLNAGETNIEEFVDVLSIKSEDIDGYRMKGIWFFDKKQGEMRYRILAVAPVAPDIQVLGRDDIQVGESLPLFWVYYPDAREILHKGAVFNPENHGFPISFDHLLNTRRFNSLILREENLYGNRSIAEYVRGNALFRIIESERIKERIRNKELDMWNY